MKEFDLEAAKAGKKVMTRAGLEARIICFDKRFQGETNMVVLLKDKLPFGNYNELIRTYKLDGTSIGKDRDKDLVMASEKKEGYVNLYKSPTMIYTGRGVSETEDEAKHSAALRVDRDVIHLATIKIEWEE